MKTSLDESNDLTRNNALEGVTRMERIGMQEGNRKISFFAMQLIIKSAISRERSAFKQG